MGNCAGSIEKNVRKGGWGIVVGVFLTLSVVALALWIVPRGSRIDESSYDQIHVGMKVDEVTAVIGVPEGIYHEIDGYTVLDTTFERPVAGRHAWWVGPSYAIHVGFDSHEGRAVGKSLLRGPPRNWWERFAAHVGLR